MGSPYVGEIRMFGGNFAPAGWALCQGQLLPISENEVLFNLIGTTYGGDGQNTFALPDLQGRLPVHQGTFQGMSWNIGLAGGVEQVTLTTQQIPAHSHPVLASTATGGSRNPVPDAALAVAAGDAYVSSLDAVPLNASQAITSTGGSQPHENMQPYLCINFIISLFGVFPSQT
jgi:microcystin-dependent protein